jgi:probable F420-dependent oxidoreductase
MRVGVVFPQLEIGNDPAQIKAYAQAAESLGYSTIVAFDHVLGAHPDRPGGWQGPYTHQSAFHEPLVLFAFLAAVTQRIQFAPGVIILPQRQTALVAKQAAELDVLSAGRFRLGVGLGWNRVEYEALNENFKNRARRIEEQIVVLRLLWTQEVVDYRGQWHRIDRAGLNPMPVQRPIPIWMGGNAEPAVRRIARLADGWMSHLHLSPEPDRRARIEAFRTWVREAGRDPAGVGIQARVQAAKGDPASWAKLAASLIAAGADHLEFNTMGAGYKTVDDHIAAIRRFREVAPAF